VTHAAEKFIQSFADGQVIFVEGDPGSEMFVVVSGNVDITKHDGTGAVSVASLGTGEMFGEMALVAEGKRMATATARGSDTQVVCIDQARFLYLVSHQPAFALSVMRMMAHRLAGIALTPGIV
jgi:CRP-like cAMP-binding protein